MPRVLFCDPVPHDLEHADHALKLDTTQCSAQACLLQARLSCRYGQAYPPAVAFCSIDRVRDCNPVPHDLEHADHALKLDTTQCTGQACVLQACVSALWGQALPPFCGWVLIRVRLWKPPPHEFVQVVITPKLLTKQSWGQTCALHGRVSVLCGQATPPCSGWVLTRVRLWKPPPHDLVQVVQAPKLPTTQLTGHN